MIDDIFFSNKIRECMGYSAASNYTYHLSRQGSSSKPMAIISFFSGISKTSILMLDLHQKWNHLNTASTQRQLG